MSERKQHDQIKMKSVKLDSEIAVLLDEVQETMAVAHTLSAEEVRATFQAARNTPATVTPVHEVSDLAIASPNGNIACRVYKPTDDTNLPVLIWFHGGGWVLGDLESADFPCRELAALSQCIVLSVDYRLAPEAPFPAAFDDCLTVVQWTVNNASSLNANKHRIAIGGDSAGANLAACVSIAARDSGLNIKFQLLVYPVVEADFENASYTENADGYFLTRNMMKWFWDHYVPDHASRTDPRVAPMSASLKGLPPAWVLTAGFDPLRDEGLKYAAALASAGVSVSSQQVDDTVHGFFTMPVQGGAKARSEAARQLQKAFFA